MMTHPNTGIRTHRRDLSLTKTSASALIQSGHVTILAKFREIGYRRWHISAIAVLIPDPCWPMPPAAFSFKRAGAIRGGGRHARSARHNIVNYTYATWRLPPGPPR